MREAVQEARITMMAADRVVSEMAGLLRGRLRNVYSRTLADLKKELRNFNAHTGEWKK